MAYSFLRLFAQYMVLMVTSFGAGMGLGAAMMLALLAAHDISPRQIVAEFRQQRADRRTARRG